MKFNGIKLAKYVITASVCTTTLANEGISEKQIERFATAITQINHYYIKPVTYQSLFDSAIKGMLTSLDPHSDYLSPKDIKELQASTTGEYAGIGVEVIPDNGLIKVISPFDGTPAQKAGIKSGDIIVKVGNKLIKDVSTDEAIELIMGPVGSSVQLTILRAGSAEHIVMDVNREIIEIKSVKSKVYRSKLGYTKVANFGDTTAKDVKEQILGMEKSNNIKGMVIDLRNNPGGTLTAAIETSDLFLDKQNLKNDLIVYTRGRLDIDNMEAYATPGDILKNKPIVVLINNGSASASEILAGAIKDQKRGVVMGTPSFGKGSVQTVIPIDYESAIKLTTALYYTPNGISIQAHGILPDVYAPYTKFPEQEAKNNISAILDNINESSLDGHITASKTAAQTAANLEKKEKQAELAFTDFQLYQALNLLEAMSLNSNSPEKRS
ncbi:MAG: S41 family peptidase [Legionellales bacterium]|jgi:carboxyl-terminal processing protease|nr:S41 family peptidase [Legionellales bacterium]